jgi:hypothetical protein
VVDFDRLARPRRLRRYGMLDYRLYFLDSATRHIIRSFEFEASDDEQAARIAEAWREGRALELWNGARKLRTWEADAPKGR